MSPLKKRDILDTVCGSFPSVANNDASDIKYTVRGRNGDEEIPAKSCLRLKCKGKSGLFVCNDQDVDIEVPSDDVIEITKYGTLTCRKTKGANYSYQVFTSNQGGYNVVSTRPSRSQP